MSRFVTLSAFGLVSVLALGLVPGASSALTSASYLAWESPTRIDAAIYGDSVPLAPNVVMDSEGNALAVWFQVRERLSDVWANRFVPGQGWGTPIMIGENAAPEGDTRPAVAIGPSDEVVVVWPGSTHIRASYFTPDAGWRSVDPVLGVESRPLRPQVVIADTGMAMVMWEDEPSRVGYVERYNLWAAPLTSGQGWGEPVVLEQRAEDRRLLYDAPRADVVARSGRSEFVAAWVRTRGTENDLVASHFVPDEGWRSPTLIASDRPHIATLGLGGFNHDSWGHLLWAEGSPEPEGNADDSDIWAMGIDLEPSLHSVWSGKGPEHEYSILWPAVAGGQYLMWCGHEDGHCHDLFIAEFECCAHGHWISLERIHIDPDLAYPPGVRISSGGTSAFILWAQLESSGERLERRIWASRSASNWEFQHRISTSEYAQDERVAVDHGGNAVAVWRQLQGDRATLWASAFLVEPVFDTTAPPLSLTSPRDGFTTSVPTVTVAGLTEPEATLVVNGIRIDLASDGSFRFPLALSEGSNTITATASDAAGNVASATVRVTHLNALPPLEDQLRETNDALDDTNAALDASNAALGAANQRVLLLLLLQVVLAASIAVGLGLNRIRLRGGPGSGGSRFGRDNPGGAGRETGPGKPTASAPPSRTARESAWPETAPIGDPLHVTAKERVLIHLLGLANHESGLDVPRGLTQGGVAGAAGFNRRHFTQYVRPLVRRGLVQEKAAHVEGSLQRRKVYVLTEKGKGAALRIRDRLASVVIRLKDESGVREAAIAEVLHWIPRSRSLLEIVREAIETGVVSLEA